MSEGHGHPGGQRSDPADVRFECFVPGTPRPQGSGTIMVNRAGRGFTKAPALTAWWRNQMVDLFAGSGVNIPEPIPVTVGLEFRFLRPKSHTRRRREADGGWKSNGSDIDKLSRLVLDALTVARVIDDDRQVVVLIASKVWLETWDAQEGVMVWVRGHPGGPSLATWAAILDVMGA